MLNTLIPTFDKDAEVIRAIATAGFTVCFNFTFKGPEHIHSEFPQEWSTEYERKSYYAMDPVLMWGMTHTGHKRWSEIQLPDVRKILKRGAEYGLNYGAVTSAKRERSRSFLSLARSDRELSNEEMDRATEIFQSWCDQMVNKS